MRGHELRDAIRAVVDLFGADASDFVFIGGCVIGLYAREAGAPLRTTKDVDLISTLRPWMRQAKRLADLCQQGILDPDSQLACRYHARGADLTIDVLSPEGFNVGGVNPWFERAAEHAALYTLEGGAKVRAVTPPYFLATKLAALMDTNRNSDLQSSKDAEDIVTLAIEVPNLMELVQASGIATELAGLLRAALARHQLDVEDLDELVEWHLDQRDAPARERVIETLRDLAGRSQEPSSGKKSFI